MAATPVQISTEWWMALSPDGTPFYHNTATKETTWLAPMLSLEAQTVTSNASASNLDDLQKQADSAAPATMAAQQFGLKTSDQMDQSSSQQNNMMQMMQAAAPPKQNRDITTTGRGDIPPPWWRFEDVKFMRELLSLCCWQGSPHLRRSSLTVGPLALQVVISLALPRQALERRWVSYSLPSPR